MRVGIIAGAVLTAGLMMASLGGAALSDSFAWFLIAIAAGVGGYLGCELVIAVTRVRQAPIALLHALGFLVVVSLVGLAPYGVDAVREHWFLSHADSAQGVVNRAYVRGGKHLWITYAAGDSSRVVTDRARRDTYQLEVGDTAWVYWDPKVPTRATIGRPAPDWPEAFNSLVPLCLIGGVLFLAYGINATRAAVPEEWRRPLQALRAFLGAAAMADVGFWLAMLDWQKDLTNPQLLISKGIWSALAFMALFCFIFTVGLGGAALLLLLERRWTSGYAFALCGMVFGAAACGLLGGLDGLFVGSVSGLFAGLAFRWLYFRGAEPSVDGKAPALETEMT